jgi:hypothetical protein
MNQPLAIEDGPESGAPRAPPGGGANLTMNGLAATEEEPLSELDAALRKLVNIDHIDEPAEEKLKLTMKREEDEKAKRSKNKSAPKPAVAHQLVGRGATLEQIKTVKPEAPPTRDDIMKPPPQLFHPNAAMAGALVVHGQPMPPMMMQPQAPMGFGAGYGYGAPSGYGAAGGYGGGYPPQQAAYHAPPPPPPQQQGYGYR